MRATDVMRGSFASVGPGTSLLEVARLLLQTSQRGLPVLDVDGSLLGIVSEGDLLHRQELGVEPPAGNWLEQVLGFEEHSPARERMRALGVEAIMTPNPVCVDADATVADVVAAMDRRHVGQIPVISEGKVIGIVNRFELISALERSLSQRDEHREEAME